MPRVDDEDRVGGARAIFNGTQDLVPAAVFETTWARYENYDGIVTDDGIDVEMEIVLPRQTEIDLAWSPNKEYYDGTTYDNPRQQIYVEFATDARLVRLLLHEVGKDDRLRELAAGRLLHGRAVGGAGAARRLSVAATFTQQRLDVEGGELYTAKLLQTKLVWNFSTRSFVRLIVQHDDVRRNPELYLDPVEAHSEELFRRRSSRTRSIRRPSSSSATPTTTSEATASTSRTADRTLFLKVGYAWVF